MEQIGDWIFWLVLIVMFIAFVSVPQWMAQRRRKQQMDELSVGDRVMTIGGLLGTLVQYNPEENVARIKLADDVVVDILPGAISGKRRAKDEAPSEE